MRDWQATAMPYQHHLARERSAAVMLACQMQLKARECVNVARWAVYAKFLDTTRSTAAFHDACDTCRANFNILQ